MAICLQSMHWMGFSQRSLMSLALVLWCLRSSMGRGTLDFISLTKHWAFWVKWGLWISHLHWSFSRSQRYTIPYLTFYSQTVPGMEAIERRQGVGADGPDTKRNMQHKRIFEVCECWVVVCARRPKWPSHHGSCSCNAQQWHCHTPSILLNLPSG